MNNRKEKHTCSSCIHYEVCEYSIYKAEIICDDYISKYILLELKPSQKVCNDITKFITAMRVMKTICKGMIECSTCPMYNNCKSTEETKRFPSFWNIPEE